MKTIKRTLLVSCASALPLLGGISPAHGQATNVVINIDLSNPAAVTFSATDNLSLTNATGILVWGVCLQNFFTAAQSSYPWGSVSGDLAATLNSGTPYDNWMALDDSGSPVDLNLFVAHDYDAMDFSNSTPAFTGGATVDLTAVASYLPTIGQSGNVTVHGNNLVVGSWQVVPEPATMVLAILGGGSVLFLSRRNRRRTEADEADR